MKRSFSLLALILGLSQFSYSEAAPRLGYFGIVSGYRVSSETTADSSVLLEGPMPSDAKGILVTIARAGDDQKNEERTLFPAERGDVSSRIYLRKGAGDYTIGVFSCPDQSGMCNGIDEFKVTNTDDRDNSFLLPSSDIQSDDPQVIALSRALTAGLRSDSEKSRAIHRWVTSNIAYDTQAFFSNKYQEMPWDASTVYQTKQAICQGYSNLNAALHRAAGIRAKVIIGSAASVFTGSTSASANPNPSCNHAWNEVLIDGQWLPEDTTWDAGYVDFLSQKFTFAPNEEYLFPQASEFAKSHTKCSEEPN